MKRQFERDRSSFLVRRLTAGLAMALIANPLALDVDDAALLTGASQYLLRDSIRNGDLPARRLGRQVLIRFSDLEKWVDGLPPLHSVEERPK